MRVLQVLLSPRIGGAESAASSLASVWREQGHESDIAYLDATGAGPFQRLRHISREVHAFRPDVVVSHSAIPNLYTRLAVRRTVAPIVCVLHSATRDLDDRRLLAAEKVLRRRAAAIIAVSASQVDEYRNHFPGQHVDLVPNGVGAGFAPASTRPDTFTVVTVGRVAGQKDPIAWAQIASLAASRDERLRFDWVGPTGIESAYAQLEHEYRDAPGRVRFVGPTANVCAALQRARIVLHTAHREAHSVALLEAAASGLPIVCTHDVGRGLPDWIVRDEFPAGDAHGGLAAVERVVNSIDSFEKRSRAIAPRVLREFGVQACAERYLEVFRRVL